MPDLPPDSNSSAANLVDGKRPSRRGQNDLVAVGAELTWHRESSCRIRSIRDRRPGLRQDDPDDQRNDSNERTRTAQAVGAMAWRAS